MNAASQVVCLVLWPVQDSLPLLTTDVLERLPSYIRRYAQTLGATVHGVGGAANHLHIVVTFPPAKAITVITGELRGATARFVREALGQPRFGWSAGGEFLISIAPDDIAAAVEYVETQTERHAGGALLPDWEALETIILPAEANEELPEWLRDVLHPSVEEKRN